MTTRRPRRLLATTSLVAAGAVGLLAVSPVASASPATAGGRLLPADVDALPRGGAVEYGNVDLRLSGGAAGKLKSAGTKISGSGSASVKGSGITFEALAESGPLDVTQMAGAVGVEGGLTAKGKKGSVKVTKIVFQPGTKNKNVVAKVGSKLVELGSLSGGKASLKNQADGTLKGAKLSLSAKGAKALNAKTGGGFSAGAFASVEIVATTRELPLKSGTATLTLAPGLLDILAQNGLEITTTAPATRDGNKFSIALAAGAFDPENVSGRLQLEGNVRVGRADKGVNLFGWRGVVGPKQKELFAQINDNVAAPVADIDVTNFSANFEGKNFVARGIKLKLSAIAVQTIKQQFGIAVAAGTEMGDVDINGEISGE